MLLRLTALLCGVQLFHNITWEEFETVTGPALVLSVCSGMWRIVPALRPRNCCRVCQTVALCFWERLDIAALSCDFQSLASSIGTARQKIVFTDKTGWIPGRGETASVEQKSSCSWVRESTMFVWVDCAVNGPGERLCQEDFRWGLAIVLLHGGYRTNVNWRRNFNCGI